jgi:predicted nuclease with TOPRIM domain
MEEFKDACLGLDVLSEEIVADLRDLPIDYKLAERYKEIDQEIYEILNWYENIKRERKKMEERLKRVDRELRLLNNDVQTIKLREFSRVQHEGLYSRLHQNQRP